MTSSTTSLLDSAIKDRHQKIRAFVDKLVPNLNNSTLDEIELLLYRVNVMSLNVTSLVDKIRTWKPSLIQGWFYKLEFLRNKELDNERQLLTTNLMAYIDSNSGKLPEFAEHDAKVKALSKQLAKERKDDLAFDKKVRESAKIASKSIDYIEPKMTKPVPLHRTYTAVDRRYASSSNDDSDNMLTTMLMLNAISSNSHPPEPKIDIAPGHGEFGGAGASDTWASEEESGRFS